MKDRVGWRAAGPSPEASCWTGVRRLCLKGVFKRSRLYVSMAAVSFLIFLVLSALYLPDQAATERPLPEVTLLIWTHPFGEYRALPDCLELYQVSGCALTDDPQAYPQADAVIIHHREIAIGEADLPSEPRPGAQKWIWMNYESPTHTPGLWFVEGVFNLTMSYRTDSDIFLPYGYLVPRGRKETVRHGAGFTHALSNSSRPRKRFVAWVISNWSASHARVGFYHQLRRFIPVHVFGAAGRPLQRGEGSVARLLRRYMFYLALENSQHTDYITEKLWNAVQAGAVPVVLGPSRKNYERFLPAEAFIHVNDFPSVRELARYLVKLRGDPLQMRRHLDWRRSYSLHQPRFWGEHYCMACRAVRRSTGRSQTVTDLTRWFHS
ncbi:PREDICTED: alpha-(1,3)-fucosyltransferase 4-like [Cyprinodon variegatus]|uniref:Fucosyltransferase n=1 Tax=Cyprinodon variegatus TaxID=28743 RepID=A0A3Q2CDM1_CYPVA|nr:PREDICTED: alpha-(1,3)-fucosyltransferase 4-like [Cyprinodon variegatus]